jgi:hypothetical protein
VLATDAGLHVSLDLHDGWICPACVGADKGRRAADMLRLLVLAVEAQHIVDPDPALRAALTAAKDQLR